jgi:septum formation protein
MRFEFEPSRVEEKPIEGESPPDFARRAACDKAIDVWSMYPDRCVLGADTVVEINGGILGKPTGTARVRFVELCDDVISWYVATGEPMDKAGAYAIQGVGGLLVAAVHGSPQTVVGLPIHRLPELFAEHSIEFWRLLNRRS